MEQKLESQIKVVAEARDRLQWAKTTVQDMRDIWERRYADELSEMSSASLQVAEAEALLRELTLQAYAETGNKAPAVGVGVREVTTYFYDPTEALTWAKEHSLCLKLDVEAFKKQVKVSPLPFVTATTEPQATIATELEIKE